MATSFWRNQILSTNSEEDHGRNISVKFHQNPISSFREVNAQTDALTDGQTHDGPWHKLAGHRPVELKMLVSSIFSFSNHIFRRLCPWWHQKMSLSGEDCRFYGVQYSFQQYFSYRSIHLSMLSLSSFNQYSTLFFFQATLCFPT